HGSFKRRNRFLATDEERHDPLREYDDVAEGKDGKSTCHGPIYGRRHSPAQQTPGTIHSNCSLYSQPQWETRLWPTTGKRSAPAQTKSRSTRRSRARVPAFPTMRSPPARSCRSHRPTNRSRKPPKSCMRPPRSATHFRSKVNESRRK